jgi:hypothetical protein
VGPRWVGWPKDNAIEQVLSQIIPGFHELGPGRPALEERVDGCRHGTVY